MPLAVTYPSHIRYTINAHLKEGWSIKPEDERITTPAARFSYGSKVSDRVLTLSYEYETLTDHVLPAAATSHIKNMARASDLLVYRVTPPGGKKTQTSGGPINWSVLFAALFASLIACFAAVRVSRAQLATVGGTTISVAPPVTIPRNEPVGLGGWLILVGLGVTLSPFRVLWSMSKTLPSYGAATWGSLTTPGAANYDPAWAPILMFELIGNIGLVVFYCLLIWLFYRRMRLFPTVFIWVTALGWVFFTADELLAGLAPAVVEPTNWPGIFRQALVALIWISYMRRSRRVRNTFVN